MIERRAHATLEVVVLPRGRCRWPRWGWWEQAAGGAAALQPVRTHALSIELVGQPDVLMSVRLLYRRPVIWAKTCSTPDVGEMWARCGRDAGEIRLPERRVSNET